MTDFHFLRPLWLLAIVPIVWLAWRLWAVEDAGRAWRGIVAPHLLPQLLVGREQRSWFRPATLLPVMWLLAAVALAGPTWRREPTPLAGDETVLAVVLKVTPSMQTQDVQPTRLTRATEKLRDLLQERPGTKTALFAYAGSVHRVLPPTDDAAIVESFAGELSPEVMPKAGDAAADALMAADEAIRRSGRPGWVLWLVDGVAPDQLSALEKYRREVRAPITLLAVAGEGPERTTLKSAAAALDAPIVSVTPDDADVKQLARNRRLSTVRDATVGERWLDFGYWLVWQLALVALGWCRRGWLVLGAGGAG